MEPALCHADFEMKGDWAGRSASSPNISPIPQCHIISFLANQGHSNYLVNNAGFA